MRIPRRYRRIQAPTPPNREVFGAVQLQPASKQELVKGTRSVLRAIQRSPERIRSYFTPEPVRYAA